MTQESRGTFTQVPNIFLDTCDMPETAQIGFLRLMRYVGHRGGKFTGSLRKLSETIRMPKGSMSRMVKAWQDHGLVILTSPSSEEMTLILLLDQLWGSNAQQYQIDTEELKDTRSTVSEINGTVSEINGTVSNLDSAVSKLVDEECQTRATGGSEEALNTSNKTILNTSNKTSVRTQNKKSAAPQETLLEAPLTEPQMSGSWSHEKVVQYAEWCHGKRYTAKQREEQLKAAKKLHDYNKDYTLEQFKLAFDTRNDDWWCEHQGRLDVNDLSAKGSNGSLRMEDMLKRLEKGNKSQLRVVSPPPEQERASVLVPERQKLINMMKQNIGAGWTHPSFLKKYEAGQEKGYALPADLLEQVYQLPKEEPVRSNAL